MTDEDIDFGKYYELDNDGRYFSIDLQRRVSFEGTVAVKPLHRADMGECFLWIGKLVDTNGNMDYDTNNEIEFVAEDVISEYEFKDKILPFILPLNSI